MKNTFFLILLFTLSASCSISQDYGALQNQLEAIHEEDQQYRLGIDSISQKYGAESDELNALWKVIHEKDTANLLVVTNILEKYGWLSEKQVGFEANQALFLVIQHANQKTQERFLPLMRKAVQEGKAEASQLALLEDRVALRQGKKQRYGSQIGRDKKTGAFFVEPLEDPNNVDKRRAAVGLEPLAAYLKHWNLSWDPKQPRIKH